MTLWQRNLLLALIALLLAATPLLFLQGAEWGGADTQSVEAIQELQSDYEPWFESVFSPEDMERYVFGLQALIGTLLVVGAVGWMMGRYRAQHGGGGRELTVAGAGAAVAVVVGIVLFFVQTEFGELQAFISALQGLCFGVLGFFPGYQLGRRQAGGAARARV
jgi:cobalt/nickel transport protein